MAKDRESTIRRGMKVLRIPVGERTAKDEAALRAAINAAKEKTEQEAIRRKKGLTRAWGSEPE